MPHMSNMSNMSSPRDRTGTPFSLEVDGTGRVRLEDHDTTSTRDLIFQRSPLLGTTIVRVLNNRSTRDRETHDTPTSS